MNTSLLGAQITKFRKAAGLTQEDLGRAVGVTTQAVSRWENGGAPDVTLLPAIADKLHVTVDALFGREGGKVQDMEQVVANWIRSLPVEQRLDQICRLAFAMVKFGCFPGIDPPGIGYMKNCEISDSDGQPMLLPAVSYTDYGIANGVFADDLCFVSFFPEPAAGYKVYFSSNEEYRELFRILAQPGTLEVIMSLANKQWKYYTPGVVAKRAGIPEEQAKEALDALVKLHMATPLDLECDTGEISAYNLRKQFHLIPFLYFARLLRDSEGFFMNWEVREKPLLRSSDQ